ncbi:MAG: phosphopantetheine-binding protein, partial [Gammaproteobacteria bacterium]|nr:phosphopantetheine-binding protein [Gammaproteobacteria bacterium]
LKNELVNYLRARVPDYMIPAHFVKLEKLPLTPNGKLDRASLPKPDREARLNDNVYIAPVTELEKKISAIWSTVLGVDSVGLQDNFFDLGGNSILAMKLIFRLRQKLQLNMSMTILFEYPMFENFTKMITVELKDPKIGLREYANDAQ